MVAVPRCMRNTSPFRMASRARTVTLATAVPISPDTSLNNAALVLKLVKVSLNTSNVNTCPATTYCNPLTL